MNKPKKISMKARDLGVDTSQDLSVDIDGVLGKYDEILKTRININMDQIELTHIRSRVLSERSHCQMVRQFLCII